MLSRKWQPSRAFWIAAALAFGVTVALQVRHKGTPTTRVPFSEFLNDVERSNVASIEIVGDTLHVTRPSGDVVLTTAPGSYLAINSSMTTEMAKKGVKIDVRSAAQPMIVEYGSLILGVLFLGVLGFSLFASPRVAFRPSKASPAKRMTLSAA